MSETAAKDSVGAATVIGLAGTILFFSGFVCIVVGFWTDYRWGATGVVVLLLSWILMGFSRFLFDEARDPTSPTQEHSNE